MKLPPNTHIAAKKLREYLLVWQGKDDKSQWLASAGYTIDNWQVLQQDLRNQVLSKEAVFIESTRFGRMYEIRTELKGPNGKDLFIRSYWMIEAVTEQAKFITLFPNKERIG